MEILNAYSGNGHPSATFYEHKRYTNFIDLDSNYRLLGEVFRVDDLLDFSNEDIAAPICNSVSFSVTEAKTNNDEPPTEGCRAAEESKEKVEEALELIDIPCDDIAELEWLSNFVEDSSSIDEAPKLAGASFPFKGTKEFVAGDSREEVQCESPPSGLESSSASGGWKNQFPDLSSVPARARSKRSRTGSKVWSSDILTTPSSSTASGSSEPVSMLDDTSATPLHCFTATCSSSFSGESSFDMQESYEQLPPAKKSSKGKKKQENSQLQKCLHCGSQKTPQWRTGPLGPKTLCNACGVRFKSGRLFPEYRPAASPTFLPQVHSNSHKKVLEMRRQKEDA